MGSKWQHEESVKWDLEVSRGIECFVLGFFDKEHMISRNGAPILGFDRSSGDVGSCLFDFATQSVNSLASNSDRSLAHAHRMVQVFCSKTGGPFFLGPFWALAPKAPFTLFPDESSTSVAVRLQTI